MDRLARRAGFFVQDRRIGGAAANPQLLSAWPNSAFDAWRPVGSAANGGSRPRCGRSTRRIQRPIPDIQADRQRAVVLDPEPTCLAPDWAPETCRSRGSSANDRSRPKAELDIARLNAAELTFTIVEHRRSKPGRPVDQARVPARRRRLGRRVAAHDREVLADGKLVVLDVDEMSRTGSMLMMSAYHPASQLPGLAGQWFIVQLKGRWQQPAAVGAI
jgi:hypothetical protein